MRLPGPLSLAVWMLASFASPAFANLPYVTHISTNPDPACATGTTHLVVEGMLPTTCGRVLGTEQFGAELVIVNLRPFAAQDTMCGDVSQPWRREFDLGQLPAGPRSVDVQIRVFSPDASEPPQIFTEPFAFIVVKACGVAGPLPYVDAIGVTAAPPCNPATVVLCRNDSIGVCIRGTFPNGCYSVVGIELLPSPIVGPSPEPPIVRVTVDDGACRLEECTPDSVPWIATATLPPLPTRGYGLIVELAVTSPSCPVDSMRLHSTIVPFSVQDCGPPPQPCVRGFFVRHFDPRVCDAVVSPGHPAEVGFAVGSGVPLAGLEGQFDLQPSGLKIVGVEPIGVAAGFQLQWTPSATGGAHFVLFADDPGEEIPGGSPSVVSEILRLRVAASPDSESPERTALTVTSLFGSDAHGNAVPFCPNRADDERLRTFVLCVEAPCEFNHDGVLDVRDLVLMVNCLHGPCVALPGRGDCNHDSTFTIDDVICCATRLLREQCVGCPVDSAGRSEPGIAVSFGAPVFGDNGIDVPVRILGAERIGGAKLTLQVPADRYDVTPELIDTNHRWLHVHDLASNQLVLGLFQTAQEVAAGPQVLDLVLHLRERPGATPGGTVALRGADLSGRDGVRLIADTGRPSLELGGPPHLTLGESRPNPTNGSMRFALTLDRPGEVDVAIYDVTGRRITTLLTGPQPAGSRDIVWNGRSSDGREVPGGLYFYRGSAGGHVVSRKVVLLRGR